MADSRVRHDVEDWIRTEWLPKQFGKRFEREKLKLSSGGEFAFAAVSEDRQVVAMISTSQATTSGGTLGIGKLQKIRADMLFLVMLLVCEKRLVILTERSMYEQCMKERESGRTPRNVEFLHAEIPDALRVRLRAAQNDASAEVRPRGK
ncbi:MAG: hypothetical protein KF912_01300 [Phycisphaeraceae bacterium]|nr:hypothetical protein [Phycisphaeraceae bacterium]MBX3365935.1 hypothetical protein [Phycisphaeraceae bacterium]